MHYLQLLSHLPTAISIAFAGVASYEAMRANRLATNHSKRVNAQHRREEAVRAVVRFDDEIAPNIQNLLHFKLSSLPLSDYWTAINTILNINKWSVYVDSDIADNRIIKQKLFYTLRNFSIKYAPVASKINDSHIYKLNGYFSLLRRFDIMK